ncbi:hypothetical protein OG393_29160 [Streptomyces sp. NBC_01216]|uniref:hypothetical protein n=1 Tax=Streptomyces sp. NBC_01216 TaxID=2903778 RepID=UPI002E15B409|nr:hypothetical protein OG393_29160 [Streptomyces sp. NBC_01216]
MTKPTLTRWQSREIPTPALMRERVTDPQKYYANMPNFSARGVKIGGAFPVGVPPNQPLYAGQRRDVIWNRTTLSTRGFTTTDGIRFRIPEDGVYHVTFNAAVWGNTVRAVGENLNAYITADGANGLGASGDIGHTTFQHQHAGSYTTIRVSITEYFTKGTSIRSQVYLDSGATGRWGIASSQFDADFNAFMLSPSAGGWRQAAVKPPNLTPWKDNAAVSVSDMNRQTFDTFAHLENRPRFTARGTSFNVSAGQEKVALPWSSMYANDSGFTLRRLADGYADRTAITVPYSGMYLVNFFCSAQHTSGVDTASYGFQFKIHGNSGSARILAQNTTTRINQDCSVALEDLIYLGAGEPLNVRFYGWGTGTRWVSGKSDGRINTLGAVYMGG